MHLAAAFDRLAIGEEPDIGLDAGIVEEVGRQSDDRLDPVMLQHPAPDLALAAAGTACKERRAIHDNADARAGLVITHLGNHVLQEEKLAVGDARRASTKAAIMAHLLGLSLDRLAIFLPVDAIGRIADHVVEFAAPVGVIGEGVAEGDLVRIMAGHQHVGTADREGFGVDFLAVEFGTDLGIDVVQGLFGQGEHAAGAAGRIIDLADNTQAGEFAGIGLDQEVDNQADDLARREMLPGSLVGNFREAADQLFE